MYSMNKITHPATGVEHALTCNFFNHSSKSLVVAGANIIRVFHLIPDVDLDAKNFQYTDNNPPKMKLECLAQYTLFGNVMSMQTASLADSTRDALVLGFRGAKLSIVEYDVENHGLKTLSLHYFEEEEMKGGWEHNYELPLVRVDPENRCALMLVYGRRLAILPFRVDTLLEIDEDGASVDNPVLASYIITLQDIDPKLENVIDVQFLHGYYEPTVLILYEPVRTFSGRLAVRRDTCCMVTVSLNLSQRVHPIIWSLSGLPYDCVSVVPVMRPIGGVLVCAVNSLLYLNQSVPPYGVALNSLAETITSFPLKSQETLNLTLDGAQCSFIEVDKMVISLKNGELYVLTMQVDSIRNVRGFHFQKAAASVLTTCICTFEEDYLFLGSRLGNSLLLRFSIQDQAASASTSTVQPNIKGGAVASSDSKSSVKRERKESKKDVKGESHTKKKKLDTLGDWMASNVSDIRDIDELEVYGNELFSSQQITSYVFEVSDTLLNIGPCGTVCMGEPAFLSEEFSENVDTDVELVTTSGYGKNGALCVLQRSVRPHVVTTFELPGYHQMWTVIGNNPLRDHHGFLILSQQRATMILQTGQEINELDKSGFVTDAPTIFACNLGNNRYIVQVTENSVRLIQGLEQVQHIPWDMGSALVRASASDPHVVLLAHDGQIILLTLREVRQGVSRLAVQRPTNYMLKPRTNTICLYKDTSGLFSHSIPEMEKRFYGVKKERNLLSVMKGDVEDEDELLYSDAGPQTDIISQSAQFNIMPRFRGTPWWKKYIQPIKPTHWLFVTRENGTLELYSLPDFKLSYIVANLSECPSVLVDSLGHESIQTVQAAMALKAEEVSEVEFKELLVVPLGHNGRRPVLLLRLENELLVYVAYRYPKGLLKVRFKRLATLTTRDANCRSRVLSKSADEEEQLLQGDCKLRYFENIAGYSGVFVCGRNPHWLFLTSRGELRLHPMFVDGPVVCFSPFMNVNCPKGFLYFNKEGELRICVLPTHLSYDASWLVRKVPLRLTPHFITYHVESKTYCVILSSLERSNRYYRFNGEDKELVIDDDKGDQFPRPLKDSFKATLFSPVSWDIIPGTATEFEDWEYVTCLRNVPLAYEGTRSGLKGYIVVGTNYNYSEDVTSRGRIVIYDIIDVVPEPGQPLTKNKMKVVYAKEQKGPVTAITHVSGLLITAVGQKIYIWQLKDNDLIGVAFMDTQMYVHQMLSLKNLILVADVYKSVSLLRYQPGFRTLSLVSRDFRPGEVYGIEYLVDNGNLGFVVSDREKNLVIYMYQPNVRESIGGQRLLRKADFHLGQHANTFLRIRCKRGTLSAERRIQLASDNRHVTLYATLDGGIGYLLPLPEKLYRRLLMLQNVLVTQIPHFASLNPKEFRTYRSTKKLLQNPCRGIIDGNLVWTFENLPRPERSEISRKIGAKVDDILEDLYELQMLSTNF